MARSMWKGAIQFGLVTIPVKMYLATESKGVSFHMLHANCLGRIQMKTYCPTDDAYIERSQTVRGYEIAPNRYVVVTDDDLASVPLKTVRAIEIEQFVPLATNADATRFAKQAYYLEPEPVARKAFVLLKQVLADQGLRAVARIVLRDREQLAILDPFASTMLLSTLYWPDEIRSSADLSPAEGEVEIKPAEVAMAEQLVATMTGEFDASAHRDRYREALLAVIEAKVAGAEAAEPAAGPTAALGDLMAALEASVAAARAARSEAAPDALPAGETRRAGGTRRQTAVPAEEAPVDEAPAEEAAPARRRKSA